MVVGPGVTLGEIARVKVVLPLLGTVALPVVVTPLTSAFTVTAPALKPRTEAEPPLVGTTMLPTDTMPSTGFPELSRSCTIRMPALGFGVAVGLGEEPPPPPPQPCMSAMGSMIPNVAITKI